MSFHYCDIQPEWRPDTVTYVVARATTKGLGQIEGSTRDEFNKALLEALPDSQITIFYSDYTATIQAPPTP